MNVEQSPTKPFAKAGDEQLTTILKALSDPSRLAFVRYLSLQPHEVTVGKTNEALGFTGSLGHYHGHFLYEAKLVGTRKEGREKYIWLNREMFEQYLPGFLERL